MRLLVTGAGGFLGRHVTSLLTLRGIPFREIVRETGAAEADEALATADAVIHLAGVNRPPDEAEFETGNAEFTRRIVRRLDDAGRRATVVLSSTSKAEDPTPYGRSKLAAEEAVREYAARSGARAVTFRLPNVFGKWSRPNYNSAVATFCHNVARDLPITINDPAVRLRLVHVDDAAEALITAALSPASGSGAAFARVEPEYERTVGEIVELIRAFRAVRTSLVLPDLADEFIRKLYSTYVSFLPLGEAAYALQRHDDARGALAELLKSRWFGQVFVSRTRPGVTRGNHFHHTKTEKFVVVQGSAVIRIRPLEGREPTEIAVEGSEFRVVDIPPGHTHSITNIGQDDLVTLFWSSEIFEPSRPDTYPLPV